MRLLDDFVSGNCAKPLPKFSHSHVKKAASKSCVRLQVDDDVYLRLQHLELAMQQWKIMRAGEAGQSKLNCDNLG